MYNAKDYSGLLLLASSLGDAESMKQLAELAHAAGKENIAFTAYMTLNNIPKCLDLLIETERYPEAALMAKTYMPSQVRLKLGCLSSKLSQLRLRNGNLIFEINCNSPLCYDCFHFRCQGY